MSKESDAGASAEPDGVTPPGTDTTAFEPLANGEVVLDDADEFYLRQCHPQWVQDGKLSSQVFGYFAKDQGRLSGVRSSVETPIGAFIFYTQTLRLQSAGTVAVTVRDAAANLSRVVDDTNAPSVRPPHPVPPGHAYVDLRHLTAGQRRKLARNLADRAVRVYPDATNEIAVFDSPPAVSDVEAADPVDSGDS